jgi:hypothetical protein
MPNLAKFVSFFDKGFDVPPKHTVTDHPPHDDPGIPLMRELDPANDAFVALKYQVLSGTGRLSVTLNAVTFTAIPFTFTPIPFGPSDLPAPQVWYETIRGGTLNPPMQNQIVVEVHDDHDGSAKVHVSDFKIFYQT